jgi:PAS domain S-box-containing protein
VGIPASAVVCAALLVVVACLAVLVCQRLRGTARRDGEARFRSLFEQAGVGVVECDAASGRFLQVNGRFCEILGYSERELLGMGFPDVTHPDERGRDRQEIVRLAAGERDEYAVEKRYLRKDGAFVWAALTVRPLRQPGGPPRNMVAVIADITARKQAEAEIQHLNATLERRVAERTAELQAANQELESFAYAVSHDLRAPLRSLSGFSQALVEDCAASLSKEGLDHLSHITQAGQRMAGLIEGLLQLSRATRCELRRLPVDLSALAERLLADLAGHDPERRVRLRVEPGIRVQGDPSTLEAALGNLLENAWKYTSRTADASITMDTVEEAGRRWIRIADNGAGFDMAFAGQLYRPFQRLHRQDEFPGLGIGLATVHRIVKRHGGELKAIAAPGQGAAFWMTLPALEPPTRT